MPDPAPEPETTPATPPAELLAPPRQHRLWARRGVFAMADMGMFAGANFLITVGLAGWLDKREFGAFTTAYASFLIIGVFTTALLTEPMMVFGSGKYRPDLSRYLGRLLGGHLAITVTGGLILASIGLTVWLSGQPLLGIALLCLSLTQISQLLPWMLRPACYIESNPGPAALSGVIYLVLILTSLLVLEITDRLSVVTAICTMGGASLAANLYLIYKLRVGLGAVLRPAGYAPIARDHWRYGRWALPTGLSRYIPEQLPYVALPVVLGLVAGTAPVLEKGGALRALMNFSVPLILVGWAISTLLVPTLVRERYSPRFAQTARRVAWLIVGGPLLFWPVLGLFGEELIGFVYRGKFTEYAQLLWLIGLIPVVSGVDSILHSQLKAAERPDRIFIGSLSASVVMITVGLPMMLMWGLAGAVVGVLVSYLTQTLALLTFGGRIIRGMSVPETAADQRLRPMDLAPLPDRPLVSVLVTNYNYERFVGRAVRSVLAQTYPHLELIVVDDGSTDHSVQMLQRLAETDPRVTVLRQPNGGMASALNAAYAQSRGEIVCMLDADDEFEPEKLAALVDHFAEHPGVGMVQHPLQVIDAEGTKLQTIPFFSRLEEGWLGPAVVRRGGRWCFMPTSALAFRRGIVRYLFPIDPRRYRINADTLLFTVGPLLTRVGVVNRALARYRVHGENHMSSGATDRAELRKRIRSYYDTVVGSNRHIARLGWDIPTLSSSDHTLYREQLFVLSMLRGRRRGWVGRYAALMAAVFNDDMYGLPQKLLAAPVYGLLPFLPRGLRGPWLDRVRAFGRFKGAAQSVLFLHRMRPRRHHPRGHAAGDLPPAAPGVTGTAAGPEGGPDLSDSAVSPDLTTPHPLGSDPA